MKRFKILMASAIVFATASAFTTESTALEEFYVLTESEGMLPLSEAQEFGTCEIQPTANCKYTKDANGDYQPTNDGHIWVE